MVLPFPGSPIHPWVGLRLQGNTTQKKIYITPFARANMKRVLTRSYAKAGAGPWSSGFMPLRVGYEASRSLNNSSSNDSWNSSPTISGKVRHRATTESLRENNIVQKRFYAGASQQEKNEPKKSEPSQERESEQELSGFRRLLAEWKPIFSVRSVLPQQSCVL